MLAGIDQGVDFIAWELRPAALDELGLTKVLETYVQEWSRYAGVRANFHAAARQAGRFAPEVEASVYRIAQEALNNVAKHARAGSVNVLLEQRGRPSSSSSKTMASDFIRPRSSETMIGLAGMRERAAAVGGTLEIEPTPGGGTTVLARIPISGSRPRVARAVRAWPTLRPPSRLPPPSVRTSSEASDAERTSVRVRLQELQQAVAARDEFIATVAHELRNPIAPLTFQLRLAMEKAEQIAAGGESVPVEWVQSQLRRIEQRLHRLLETLDRLLDVSRLSTGRIDLQPEPVNLAQTVRDVIGTFEAELAVSRCELTFSQRGDDDRLLGPAAPRADLPEPALQCDPIRRGAAD